MYVYFLQTTHYCAKLISRYPPALLLQKVHTRSSLDISRESD